MTWLRRSLAAVTGFLLTGVALPVRADSYVNFVHVTCIPEARYIAFESKDVDGMYVLMEARFDQKKRAQRFGLWEAKGYYVPSQMNFECRMPESTYTIVATQPEPSERGQCSAAPSITLSLLRNGKPYLDRVTFGNDCFGGPSVYRVELSDGLQGWDKRKMTVCTTPGRDHCKLLSETYGDITKALPITPAKIAEFAASWN